MMFNKWKNIIGVFEVILIVFGMWACFYFNSIAPPIDRYIKKAVKYHQFGQFDKSIEYYNKAIKLKPNSADLYNDIGVVYKHAGRFDEATVYFKKSMEINPNSTLPYVNLGNISFQLYELMPVPNLVYEAVNYYRKAIEVDPNSIGAYNGLGMAYGVLHKYDEAIINLKKAVEINPKFAEAYNNLGNIYSSPGFNSYGEAVESFKKAVEINPEFAGAYANLANAYYALGLVEQSKVSLKKAIKLFKKMGMGKEIGTLENILRKISE